MDRKTLKLILKVLKAIGGIITKFLRVSGNLITEFLKTIFGGNFLVRLLAFLILIILSVVASAGYFRYRENHLKIETTLKGLCVYLNESTYDPNGIGQVAKCFVDKLEAITKGAAESGNITFLFTVFSIALVSGGAYLLESSREKLKKSEKTSEKANQLMESRTVSLKIFIDFSQAEQVSCKVKNLAEGGAAFPEGIATLRHLLTDSCLRLEVSLGKIKFNDFQLWCFLNQAIEIRENLKTLPVDSDDKTELIGRCDRIIEILKIFRKQ